MGSDLRRKGILGAMAALRDFRVCISSLLAMVPAFLLAAPADASLNRTRLASTVRTGPVEMVVALEDSVFLPGQRTSAMICVTNRGGQTLAFAPEPAVCGVGRTSLKVWTVARWGAWFWMPRSFTCCLAFPSWAIPPISPLESEGSTCCSTDLTSYGRYYSSSDLVQLRSDPTRALRHSRLAPGRYALQVTYHLPAEENHWREPLVVDSDTLFFDVMPAPSKPEESDLLSRYALAVDSCPGEPFQRRQELTSGWLPRFMNSRLFLDVFMSSGFFTARIPRDSLFSWLDPHGARPTSRAILLDLLLRTSSSRPHHDLVMMSAFARGDLDRRVVQDWKSRPRRQGVRDSVYAERKRYSLRGWPPYGTWIERGSP